MKKLIQIPFGKSYGKKGIHQLSYVDKWQLERGDAEMRDNYEFEGVLLYNGFSRGRSSLNIEWIDTKGSTYQSGMSLLDSILSNGNNKTVILDGKLHLRSKFTFKKQGTAYLLTTV